VSEILVCRNRTSRGGSSYNRADPIVSDLKLAEMASEHNLIPLANTIRTSGLEKIFLRVLDILEDSGTSYRTAKRSKAEGEQIQSLEYYALPSIPPSYKLGESGNTQEGVSEEVAANSAGANLSRGNNVYAAMWSEPSDSNLLRGNNLYNVIWPEPSERFDDPAQPNLSRGNNLYSAIWPEPSEGFANLA
jgi:hypothetical protein